MVRPAAAYCLSFLLATAAFSVCCSAQLNQTVCMNQTLPEGRTFDKCTDLPTLNATLHWTYDSATGNLSVGFTAPNPSGWVAWGINPTKLAMIGTQALVAFRNSTDQVMTPKTYNISGYTLTPGDISYDVSNLEAVVDNKMTMIFGTMMLQPETININCIWQTGPVADNAISTHPFDPMNLNSTIKLDLTLTNGGSSITAGTPLQSPSPPPMDSAGNNNKLRRWNLGVVLSTFFFLWLCSLGM